MQHAKDKCPVGSNYDGASSGGIGLPAVESSIVFVGIAKHTAGDAVKVKQLRREAGHLHKNKNTSGI
jgi:hypothetical protein